MNELLSLADVVSLNVDGRKSNENVKGILAQINTILTDADSNIFGQYLKKNEQLGYVITYIDGVYNPELEKKSKEIPNTIKYSIL